MSAALLTVQEDCNGRLMASRIFADVAIIMMRKAYLQSEINQLLQTLAGRSGKIGTCVMVQMPVLDVIDPNLPGPNTSIAQSFWVIEHPTLNAGSQGTGKSAEYLAEETLRLFHHFVPFGVTQVFVGGQNAIVPNYSLDGLRAYIVTLQSQVRLSIPAKVARPMISFAAGSGNSVDVTLTCATPAAAIWYTIDGSYPSSGNAEATLYIAPFNLAAEVAARTITLRAAAQLSAYQQSDIAQTDLAIAAAPPPPTITKLQHILVTGQSNAVGASALPLLSGSAGPDNTRMFNGGIYPLGDSGNLASLVPLVGSIDGNALGENICYSLAGWLAEQNADTLFLVSLTGAGGLAYNSLKQGTTCYAQHLAQVAAAKAIADGLGLTYRVLCVCVVHGEQDQLVSNTGYAADLAQWQADYDADIKAISSQSEMVRLVACQQAGYSADDGSALSFTASSSLLLLQASDAAADNIIIPSPRYMLDHPASPHFANWGHRLLGEHYAKAIQAACIDEAGWAHVRPLSAVLTGDTIVVAFLVPTPPLVFNFEDVLIQPNMGFVFEDSTDSAAISSVTITGPAEITIVLDGTPSGESPALRYACDNTGISNSPKIGGGRGNVCDSGSATSRFGFTLRNFCVMFRRML